MLQEIKYNPQDFWETRLREKFSLLGTGHSGFSEHYNTYMYKRRARVLTKALAALRIKLEGKKVLDIGCGTGFFVDYYLRNKASSVVGLDITSVSIERLKNKFPSQRFYQCDISSARLSSEENFDIINIFDVAYHITDDDNFRKAIENISYCCHEGTWLFITDSLVPRLANSSHVKYRTLQMYREILDKKGIVIIKVYPVFHLLGKSPFGHIKHNLLKRLSAQCVECAVAITYFFDSLYCPLGQSTLKLLVCKKK